MKKHGEGSPKSILQGSGGHLADFEFPFFGVWHCQGVSHTFRNSTLSDPEGAGRARTALPVSLLFINPYDTRYNKEPV